MLRHFPPSSSLLKDEIGRQLSRNRWSLSRSHICYRADLLEDWKISRRAALQQFILRQLTKLLYTHITEAPQTSLDTFRFRQKSSCSMLHFCNNIGTMEWLLSSELLAISKCNVRCNGIGSYLDIFCPAYTLILLPIVNFLPEGGTMIWSYLIIYQLRVESQARLKICIAKTNLISFINIALQLCLIIILDLRFRGRVHFSSL